MRILRLLPLLLATAILSLTSCEKDSCEQTWTQEVMVPVTINREAVQDSIGVEPAIELCTGGNIYAYGNYLFVNQALQGYQLLDNSNPSDPHPLAFLRVPGATSMAFVNGKMVSDSYADLLVLDFQGPDALTLLSSTPNFLLEENGFEVPSTDVAVNFEMQEVEFTQACDGSIRGGWGGRGFFSEDATFTNRGGSTNPSVNTAGSLARMAFCESSLYVLGTNQVTTYSLSGSELQLENTTSLGWGQQTIIRRGDFLYVAGQSALTILEVNGCGTPELLGTAPRSFPNDDPVAVEGNRAVVSLRWGDPATAWSGGSILVYDITDRTNPLLLATHELTHPVGVALYRGTLYVCDEVDGLRVFDFSGGLPEQLLDRELPGFEASVLDVAILPYDAGTVVLTIGESQLSEYSRAADGSLTELVTLNVDRCVRS